jgi:hypothetical protein
VDEEFIDYHDGLSIGYTFAFYCTSFVALIPILLMLSKHFHDYSSAQIE